MWLESHGNLARHPKTRRLMQRMGWTLPHTIGNLHLLWYWVLDFAPTGDLTRFDPDQLTQDLDLGNSTPEQFIEAMIQSGFLDSEDNVLRIHDWPEYTARSLRPKFRRHPDRWHQVLRSYGLPVPARRPSRRKEMVEHGPEAAVRKGEERGKDRSQTLQANINVPQIDSATQAGQQTAPKIVEHFPVEIPQSLSAQTGFTDTWWPKFVEMYKNQGCPLTSCEQGELLKFLSRKPVTAISNIRTALNNPRKPSRSGSVEVREHFANST